MEDVALVINPQHEIDKAESCRLHILQLRDNIANNFIALARLLKEARDGDYALRWSYANFGDWVEIGSGLDLSERSAYYLIKIVERADELGIPDSELSLSKVSSLKEIMSLPSDTDPEQIKSLVKESQTMKAKDVKEVVGGLKNESWSFHSLKFLREVEENIYQPAMERARRLYGDTILPGGNPGDISDSRCVELILADFLSQPEESEYPEIVAEWEDAVLS